MKKKRFFKIVFLFFLIVTSGTLVRCGEKPEAEKEPNDSFFTATPLAEGRAMQGFLASATDRDYYTFRVDEPAVIDIELSAIKGVNHAFQVWRQFKGQELLKHIDDSRKSSPERFCNLYCAPGTYFILVMHGDRDTPTGNSENPYLLKYKSRRYSREEAEPNDAISTATRVEENKEIKGYFSPAFNRMNDKGDAPMREEDWYEFRVSLDDFRAKLVTINLTGVPGVNATLSLYDAKKELVAHSDSTGSGEGESLRDIGISSEDRYYIMVASKSFESNHDSPYKLSLTTNEYDEGSELEPNNDIARSTALADGDIHAKIFPEGDIDFFRHTAGKGRSFYSITAAPPESLDLVMTIIGKNRQKIFEIDNGGPGESETFPNALLEPEFYVMVSAKRGQFDKGDSYVLSAKNYAFSDNYEIEPNDSRDKANRVVRKIIRGYISKKHDLDYYLLEYSKRVKITLEIDGVPGAEMKISVTDPAGYEIRSEELSGDRSIQVTEMIDGRGYLIIEALRENYERPYQVRIREE
ncbi:MAG: hypothetical protein EPN93_02765 [Spirochaetes bacterium]|nr:MAG: hypothetical protein EPN93_02765 [Spirochaetota bacterium]